MSTLLCLLEERSAEAMLKTVLPKVLPEDVQVIFTVFEGKQDLEKKLQRRIQLWQKPDTFFLVLRDQDSSDCVATKNNLQEIIKKTGKLNRSLVRIACHSLESFYLGDLAAVEAGLDVRGIAKLQTKRKFKTPDKLANANDEMDKITNRSYQKIDGSRRIASFLALDGSNKSVSFNMLISGVKTMLGSRSGY